MLPDSKPNICYRLQWKISSETPLWQSVCMLVTVIIADFKLSLGKTGKPQRIYIAEVCLLPNKI